MKFVPADPLNYKVGRGMGTINMIVIHTMQGTLQGTEAWFQNSHARVSAHYLVGKQGDVVQMVKDSDTAYHCIGVNSHSIGIEHEGFVEPDGSYTPAMYQASANLVRELCQKYAIPVDRQHIVGHSQVPGNNHSDPGPHWDWNHFMTLVSAPQAVPAGNH